MRSFTRYFAVLIAAVAATLFVAGTPAQADYANCTYFGSQTLSKQITGCVQVVWSGSTVLGADYVDIGRDASTADSCTLTGWATLEDSSGFTWDSPHINTSCTVALKTTAEWDRQGGTFYNGGTVAVKFTPYMCVTLYWSGGARWQRCMTGLASYKP